MAAGSAHTCGVRTDGSLWCWGANDGKLGDGTRADSSSPVQVRSVVRWKVVTAGSLNTCAIDVDDGLWCWGNNHGGVVGDGTETTRLTPVKVGGERRWRSVSAYGLNTCAIDSENGLWCWGDNSDGQLGTGPGYSVPERLLGDQRWLDVSVGWYRFCAVRADQTLWCRGAGGDQQLRGDSDLGGSTSGEDEGPGPAVGRWTSVTTGYNHTCALRAEGTVWCWGDDFRAGSSGNFDPNKPERLPVPGRWLEVAAGDGHTCARTAEGALWCWGENTSLQVTDLSDWVEGVPVRNGDPGPWAEADTGGAHTCAVRADRSLWCWGNSSLGQLGGGPGNDSAGPGQVAPPSQWIGVSGHGGSSGGGASCGVRVDRSLWCWGANAAGRLGDGTTINRVLPVRIELPLSERRPGNNGWTQVSVGVQSTCAIRADESLWCWGSNSSGRLGDGTRVDRHRPVRIAAGRTWSVVRTGLSHTCALATDSSLWCWGNNDAGELGIGSFAPADVPVRVEPGSSWSDVAVGYGFTCGTRTGGTLWCWGSNVDGRVGQPGAVDRSYPVPTRVGTADTWRAIRTGYFHACASRADRSLWCWGENRRGQLGDGGGPSGHEPRPVLERTGSGSLAEASSDRSLSGPGGWLEVFTGSYHTCGIREDRSLWCWGDNENGQLGDGTLPMSAQPVRSVPGAWRSVGANKLSTCAVDLRGSLWCWGDLRLGALGRVVPTGVRVE
ncbi:MAG: hypothetical protein QG608_2413 [Actinomycetota bacterium]|nr:hypothetical protein [Actinomycetota bacterium]